MRKYLYYLLAALFCVVGCSYSDGTAENVTYSEIKPGLYKIVLKPLMTLNIIALSSDDGVLLIDTGLSVTGDKLRETLLKLNPKSVKYIINSHNDGDHWRGNSAFNEDHPVIIAHKNAYDRIAGRYYNLPPIHRPDVPAVLISKKSSLMFGDEELVMEYIPGMHTDSDIIIWLKNSNVVYLSDVIFPDGFPAPHLDYGGDFNKYLSSFEYIIDNYPDDALYISTHGRDFSKEDLIEYYNMTSEVLTKARIMAKEGKTPNELFDSGIFWGWKDWVETGFAGRGQLIDVIKMAFYPESMHPKISICEPLTREIAQNSVESAVEKFYELKKTNPADFNFTENQLITLGYNLLGRSMTHDAIKIFEIAVKEYPDSFNAYDSLGEAFMAAGNYKYAFINYKKSIELNPDNQNGKNMLKRIKELTMDPTSKGENE